MEDEWPHEAKVWIGGITVAAWVILMGAWLMVDQMKKDEARMERIVEQVTDPDYLMPFRPGLDRED